MNSDTPNSGALEGDSPYIPIDPKSLFDDWRMAKRRGFEPNPRQRLLIDAVARARKEGLFYTAEVSKRVAELVRFDLSQNTGEQRVEGGDFGMDVYYARGALEARCTFEQEDVAARDLQLHAGAALGTLVFTDFKRTTGVMLLEPVDAWTWKFEGKRGAARVTGTASVLHLKHAIERATERGLRADTYAEFVASRAKLLPA
jgi:hypothetical protein